MGFFQDLKAKRDKAAAMDAVVSVRTVKWCWSARMLGNGVALIAAHLVLLFGAHLAGLFTARVWATLVIALILFNLIATYAARRIIRA